MLVAGPEHMFRVMFDRLITRRIAALVVALGVFLSGAAPAWAGAVMAGDGSMSSRMTMSMPGMDMQSACMGTPDKATLDKSSPVKHAPCKGSDSSCAVCAGCAVNVGLMQNFAPVVLLYSRTAGVFTGDAEPDSFATAPALPPPILLS